MDRNCILVQPSTHGRIKFIELTVVGDTMTSKWGLVDGKTQETSNTYDYINFGKSNELSPEDAASADFERKRDKKIKEGYKEVFSLEDAEGTAELDEIDFDFPPTSFAPSKPIKTISDSKLSALIQNKRVNVQHKYNGLCHFIAVGRKGDVRIFTRRMDDHTTKYPTIKEFVERRVKDSNFPCKSIIAVEFSADSSVYPKHMDAFNFIQRVSKSDTNKGVCLPSQVKALALQEECRVKGMVFHIPYLGGEALWEGNYEEVYRVMSSHFDYVDADDPLFNPEDLSYEFSTPQDMKDYLRIHEHFIEGLVAWDLDANIDVAFSGKPKRRACYKVKIVYEDDVIAYDFMYGKGDHQGKIGSLLIGKYDSAGNISPLGRVGSGLKDHQIEVSDWTFPVVICIEYQNRFPVDKGGKYQFPVFKYIHPDKTPDECIVEDDDFLRGRI